MPTSVISAWPIHGIGMVPTLIPISPFQVIKSNFQESSESLGEIVSLCLHLYWYFLTGLIFYGARRELFVREVSYTIEGLLNFTLDKQCWNDNFIGIFPGELLHEYLRNGGDRSLEVCGVIKLLVLMTCLHLIESVRELLLWFPSFGYLFFFFNIFSFSFGINHGSRIF